MFHQLNFQVTGDHMNAKNIVLKLHNCFAYFNQKINPWRIMFYFFHFTAPVTESLRI